jgi:hypothetical protein
MRNILDLDYVHMTLAVETDVKPNYRYQLVELAVVLLPRRGARGEDVVVRATSHSNNCASCSMPKRRQFVILLVTTDHIDTASP